MKNCILIISLIFNIAICGTFIYNEYFNIPIEMIVHIEGRAISSSHEGNRYSLITKELGLYQPIYINKFIYDRIVISKIRCLDEYKMTIRKQWLIRQLDFERNWQLIELERTNIFQEEVRLKLPLIPENPPKPVGYWKMEIDDNWQFIYHWWLL